jgi:hypothetical protein
MAQACASESGAVEQPMKQLAHSGFVAIIGITNEALFSAAPSSTTSDIAQGAAPTTWTTAERAIKLNNRIARSFNFQSGCPPQKQKKEIENPLFADEKDACNSRRFVQRNLD